MSHKIVKEKLTHQQIAEICGVSRHTITAWAGRFKIKSSNRGRFFKNKHTNPRSTYRLSIHKNKIKELLEDGLTYREIGKTLGISRSTVATLVSNLDINVPDFKGVRRERIKREVLSKLNEISENNTVTREVILSNNLDEKIRRTLGYSVKDFLTEHGYEYITSRRSYTSIEEIRDVINEISVENKITFSDIRSKVPRLEQVLRIEYGSVYNASKHLGFTYERNKVELSDLGTLGAEFEGVVAKVLDNLKIRYKRQPMIKKGTSIIRPDFVLNNNIWIDAKLANYTVYNSDTVEKYSTVCKRLIIVYGLGDSSPVGYEDYNVGFINIDNLISKIPDGLEREKREGEMSEVRNRYLEITRRKRRAS